LPRICTINPNRGGTLVQNRCSFTEYSPFTSPFSLRTLGKRSWKQERASFAYLDLQKIDLEQMAWRKRGSSPEQDIPVFNLKASSSSCRMLAQTGNDASRLCSPAARLL
jgi:hypothetical protein